jgi:type II secretory pathway component PulM
VTARDRTVLMVVGLVVVTAAFWFLALAPKRDEVTALDGRIATAQQELETARAAARTAQEAKDRYASDYAAVARLGKAVPADDDVPSLLVQLEAAADAAEVDFRTIRLEASGAPAPQVATPAAAVAQVGAAEKGEDGAAAPVAATEAVAAVLPPGAAIGAAGFPTMPFSFEFRGSFKGLEKFLDKITAFTKLKGQTIAVRGRLLTIDAVNLMAGPDGFPQMTASIKATAYLLPADQAAVPASPSTLATAAQVTPGGTP